MGRPSTLRFVFPVSKRKLQLFSASRSLGGLAVESGQNATLDSPTGEAFQDLLVASNCRLCGSDDRDTCSSAATAYGRSCGASHGDFTYLCLVGASLHEGAKKAPR